jgi:hypothetical protein
MRGIVMGSLVNLRVHLPEKHVPQHFVRLLDGLLKNGRFSYFCQQSGGSRSKQRSLPENRAELERFARDTLYTDMWATITMEYTLRSGREMSLDLDFYGSGGPKITYPWSHLAVHFERDELFRLCNTGSGALGEGMCSCEDHSTKRRMTTQGDMEALFYEICGMGEMESAAPVEAAVFADGDWSTSDACAMVYYRNPEEFGQDFSRMYAMYHWGVVPISVFPARGGLSGLGESAQRMAASLSPGILAKVGKDL